MNCSALELTRLAPNRIFGSDLGRLGLSLNAFFKNQIFCQLSVQYCVSVGSIAQLVQHFLSFCADKPSVGVRRESLSSRLG